MPKSSSIPKNPSAGTVNPRGVERGNSSTVDPYQAPEISCDPSRYSKGHPDCHFLDLPAELRSAIYSAAFLDCKHGLPLLQTCRQVNMESTTVLHQRPIAFSSQAKLFAWIEDTQAGELQRVRSITLNLTDIDLSSLFDPRSVADKRSGRSSSCWYLYNQELVRLDQALQSLPGLVSLTVVPPERSTSLVRGMFLSFLEVIPQRCPRLRQLTIYDQEILLQKVPGLRTLPKVDFLDIQDSRSRFTSPIKIESFESAVKIKRETEW